MNTNVTLADRIKRIPSDGFWKSSSEGRFTEAGARLKSLGMSDDEVVELLSDLFYTVAQEFGG